MEKICLSMGVCHQAGSHRAYSKYETNFRLMHNKYNLSLLQSFSCIHQCFVSLFTKCWWCYTRAAEERNSPWVHVMEMVVYLNLHPLTVASMFIFFPVSAISSALSLVGCWPIQPVINHFFPVLFFFSCSSFNWNYFITVQQHAPRWGLKDGPEDREIRWISECRHKKDEYSRREDRQEGKDGDGRAEPVEEAWWW